MGSPCNDDHSRGNTGRKYTAWESNIIQASLRKQNANPSSGLSTVYDSDYLVCQPVGPFHLQLTSWCFSSSFNIVPVTIIKLLLILSFYITVNKLWASLVAQRVKNLPACRRPGGRPRFDLPGSGKSPGEGNGNPLQCSCLENPRDGGSLVGCCLWGRTESDTTEVT